MKSWKNIKKSRLIAIVTGILIVVAGIVVLANASGVHSIFEPEDFANFENQYDSNMNYDSGAGDGEESDLADENEESQENDKEDTQKALQVAENDTRDPEEQEDETGLGLSEERNHEDGSEEEKNPDAFEISDKREPGGIDIRPDSGLQGNNGGGRGENPGGGSPAGTGAPTAVPTAVPDPTSTPGPTNGPEPTGTPDPTNGPEPTGAPEPTNTPAPTSTPRPTTWEDQQMKPRDPVETKDGILEKLTAVIHKDYYPGDVFSGNDATVRGIFRQPDNKIKEITLHYGGKDGYDVEISTKTTGIHTAIFTYMGVTARAQYEVISSGVSIRYHGEDSAGAVYGNLQFPGPLGGDEETMSKLSDRNIHPDSSGMADLTDMHSRIIAYLGDDEIQKNFSEDTTYRTAVFLQEQDGYLTKMLRGFRYYINGELEDGPYIYYPVYDWGVDNLRNVLDEVCDVPNGFKIRRTVKNKGDLLRYRGSQVLEQYTGRGKELSVPMGVTDIALKGQQGDGKITLLYLPESVNSIDFVTVSQCLPQLEAFAVSDRGIYWEGDGVLYSKDKKTLLSVPAGKDSIKIPDTVTAIGAGAFCNSSIRELDIPDTVAVLEKGCFQGFHGDVVRLKGEKIPRVPSDTGYRGKILFEDSDYNVLLKRGMFAFKSQDIIFGAMDEKGVEIPEKTDIYQYDSERRILTVKGETGILAGIPTDSEGRYEIPEGITAIGGGAFAGAEGLREIQLPVMVTELGEGSLVCPDKVESVFLSGSVTEVSPMVFGDPAEGAQVPELTVYVPKEDYGAYLERWSQALDPVYGEGTAKDLLQRDEGVILYEEGARYQKVPQDGRAGYRLLKVYAQDVRAFRVREGTTEIAPDAFSLCSLLEILYLPDSLVKVEDGAFIGCKNLQTVTVKDIELLFGNVFDPQSSGVRAYEKGRKFSEFIYEEGAVYGKSPEGAYTLLDVPTDYGTDFVLYENTGSLNNEAFKNCTGLKNIILTSPETLLTIGKRCFENCTAIEDIRLEGAVNLEGLGEGAFRSCTSLEALYLPDHLQETGKGICYGCTLLQVVMARGINRVSEEMFYSCQNLREAGLYLDWKGMVSIGRQAFAYCSLFTSFPDMPVLESIGNQAFFACQRLREILLPEALSSMGEECFSECVSLSKVVLNGKLTGISRYCFYGCRGLVSIEFSQQQREALQIVGVMAFGQCVSLESLDLSGFSSLRQMGERTFEGCDFLTTVKLPESLIKVPDYCFENCQNLSVLTLFSNEVVQLGESVFGNALSPYVHIWVREERLADYRVSYQSILDPAYGDGITEKILGQIREDQEIVRGITFEFTEEGRVLKEVSEIFEGNYTVPINTVRIEAEAFMGCSGLTGLTLQEGSSIILGDRCFKGCTALEYVEMNGSIPQWGEETFMDCVSMNRLIIGSSFQDQVPRIGTRAFMGCTALAGRSSVSFRAAILALGEQCFADCRNLEAIPMTTSARQGIEVLEDRAFENCTGLTQFLTSAFSGMKAIGSYVFANCDSMGAPSVPANVISMGEGVFMECDNVTTISFYCPLEEYPKNSFKNCPELIRTGGTSAALQGLRRIGESAYEGCVSLTASNNWDLDRYTNLEEIGINAFKDCASMADINLSSSVKSVRAGAFDGCRGAGQMTLNSREVPEMGEIALDTLSEGFCIRVPDSQSEGDSVYKAYLAVFSEMFGSDRAYEILDSISDGAKERNGLPAANAGQRGSEDLAEEQEMPQTTEN